MDEALRDSLTFWGPSTTLACCLTPFFVSLVKCLQVLVVHVLNRNEIVAGAMNSAKQFMQFDAHCDVVPILRVLN